MNGCIVTQCFLCSDAASVSRSVGLPGPPPLLGDRGSWAAEERDPRKEHLPEEGGHQGCHPAQEGG